MVTDGGGGMSMARFRVVAVLLVGWWWCLQRREGAMVGVGAGRERE
jgi:hypothetical protein